MDFMRTYLRCEVGLLREQNSCWDLDLRECSFLKQYGGSSYGTSLLLLGFWFGWVCKDLTYVSRQEFFLLRFWFGWVCKNMEFMFLEKAFSCWDLCWKHLGFQFLASIFSCWDLVLDEWNLNKWTLRVLIHFSFACKSYLCNWFKFIKRTLSSLVDSKFSSN